LLAAARFQRWMFLFCVLYLPLTSLSVFTTMTQLTQSQSQSYITTNGQSVLVSGTHLGPVTNFSPSLFNYFLDSCGFVDVGRALWREVGSVVFSYCRASQALPFSNLSPTVWLNWTTSPRYMAPARISQKIYFPSLRVISLSGKTTCPQNCTLAMTVLLSPVYTAVTWQWIYMLRYVECNVSFIRNALDYRKIENCNEAWYHPILSKSLQRALTNENRTVDVLRSHVAWKLS
jgi:hypothetical protein